MKMFTTLISSALIATAALPSFAAEQKIQPVIGVSLASDVNPFYIAMKRGIEERAKEVGAKIVIVTANEVVAQQVSGLQDLAAQKVDGILVSPIDAVAVRSGYETAAKAGIPVISVARHADSPHQSAFVSMDEKKVGADIAEWIMKTIDGTGEITMITGPAGAATFINTAAGFDSVLAKHPDVKVVMRKDAPLT
ncbi:MAG TPA: substrate-binding domain-containing protein, partial [Pusillimonas sp.]|uniref:substrate-binding domain-containing protein n=1 Tax=Pusillimonas sp. TaxID=3040095 RepID=UPI002CE603AA